MGDTDDLVSRCQQGEAEAFRRLFVQHRSDVARIVYRLVGGAADVEDLVQEVFLQVHRSLKDFKGQSKFSTWLHRVAVNVALMHRRAARSRPQLVPPQPDEAQIDSGIMPDESAERLERLRALCRLLDELPEKKRVVFILHELEGLAPVEIGEIVGAPVLTVRTRLFYARRELAAKMRSEPALASFADSIARDDGREGERAPKSAAQSVKRVAKAIEGAQ